MRTIIVIIGNSRVGKDTAYNYLASKNPKLARVKFKEVFSHYVEDCYALPRGAMELEEYRSAKVPGTQTTFLDLLKQQYHLVQQYAPTMTLQPAMDKAESLLIQGLDVCFTDVRRPAEMEAVAQLAKKGYKLTGLLIERPGSSGLDTDNFLMSNADQLATMGKLYAICNNGTLAYFYRQLDFYFPTQVKLAS